MANTRVVNVREVQADVLTTAGTLSTAPLSTVATADDVILLGVTLRIPKGHAGLTGIRFEYARTTIIPFNNPAQFIVGDDDRFLFDIEFEIGSQFRIVTYNTDVYDHTHHVLLKVTDVDSAQPRAFQPLSIVPRTT